MSSLVGADPVTVAFVGMLSLVFVNAGYDYTDAERPGGLRLVNVYAAVLIPEWLVLRNAGTDPLLTWTSLGLFVFSLAIVYRTLVRVPASKGGGADA